MNTLLPPPSIIPDRAYYREFGRPWKLASFAIGMAWLFYGALNYHISDWDIGVSIVMGVLAYLTAPWAATLIASALTQRSRLALAQIFLGCLMGVLVADTSYMIYHHIAGNTVYREANFPASLSLYYLCGMIWLPRASLSAILK